MSAEVDSIATVLVKPEAVAESLLEDSELAIVEDADSTDEESVVKEDGMVVEGTNVEDEAAVDGKEDDCVDSDEDREDDDADADADGKDTNGAVVVPEDCVVEGLEDDVSEEDAVLELLDEVVGDAELVEMDD